MKGCLFQIFDERGRYVHSVDISYVKIVAGIAPMFDGNVAIIDSVRPTVYIFDPLRRRLVTQSY
jgi:hypothetical protein